MFPVRVLWDAVLRSGRHDHHRDRIHRGVGDDSVGGECRCDRYRLDAHGAAGGGAARGCVGVGPGIGVTLSAPLSRAHAAGAPVRRPLSQWWEMPTATTASARTKPDRRLQPDPGVGGTTVANAVTAVQGGERYEAITLTTPGQRDAVVRRHHGEVQQPRRPVLSGLLPVQRRHPEQDLVRRCLHGPDRRRADRAACAAHRTRPRAAPRRRSSTAQSGIAACGAVTSRSRAGRCSTASASAAADRTTSRPRSAVRLRPAGQRLDLRADQQLDRLSRLAGHLLVLLAHLLDVLPDRPGRVLPVFGRHGLSPSPSIR